MKYLETLLGMYGKYQMYRVENTGTNTDTMDMKAVGVNTDAADLNMETEIPTEEDILVLPHPRVEYLKRQDSILSPCPQRRDSAKSFGSFISNHSFRFMGPDCMRKTARNVPPVICESKLDDVLTMDLHAASGCYFKRQRKKTIIDGINDLERRDRILEILGNRGIDCFTFKPKEEKKHMLYCYGVPTWITPEMIIESWTLYTTPPKSVFRFKRKGANGQLYLTETVRIEVATEEDYLKILGYGTIMVIDEVYCRVSGPRPNRMAPFCRRCSQWGHSFHLCRKSPKCFKCLGKHDAKGCMVPVRSRKCANCNGSHFANYNGCPRAIRRKVPSTQKIPEGSQTTDGSLKQPAGHLQQRDLNNILSQLDLLRKNVLEISGSDMLQENINGQMEHGNI